MRINCEAPKEQISALRTKDNPAQSHSKLKNTCADLPANLHTEELGVSEYFRFNVQRYLCN